MRTLIRAAFILAAATFAQAQGANFQGRVQYDNNEPAQFVKVELWTDGGTYRTIVTTDRLGKFEAQAPCAIIQYRAEQEGFRPAQGRVDISTMCRALEYLTLRALPGTKPPGHETASAVPPDPRIAGITPDAKKQFAAGQEALASNDLASAAKHFQKAAELYPKYAEAYQLLGVAQLQSAQKAEDLKAAEASEMKAIEIEKNLPNAYYILGLSRAMMGNTPAAEEPFTTFIAKDPTNPDGHFELAKTEFALNKFAEAEMHAKKAIELKEKNPGVEALLAYSLLRQKKAAEARECFKEYLKLDPNSPMKADVEKTIAMIDEHEKQAK